MMRDLSIYVHIPFCKAKCSYCDFLSFGGCGSKLQRRYTDALCREIESFLPFAGDYRVRTIFFGGGTPSYVEASLLGQILDAIRKVFAVDGEAEITLEGNPDSLSWDKLQAYRQMGINRLSIGLQSANDEVLKRLGRVHNYDQFVAAYSNARQAGFANINVDLMSGLPGEEENSYVRTLAKVVRLQPEHISAYSLIVEDGTPLSGNRELLDLLPDEEQDRRLYAKTKMFLANSGYERYEISNYARTGCACRHNTAYWTLKEYLGVGLGASSFLRVCSQKVETAEKDGQLSWSSQAGQLNQPGKSSQPCQPELFKREQPAFQYVRFKGRDCLDDYIEYFEACKIKQSESLLDRIEQGYEDIRFLGKKEQMEEFMFLGLRLAKGISKREFFQRFLVDIKDVYGKIIKEYTSMGLLCEDSDRLYLSDAGIDVSNVVMADFLL